MPTHKEATDIYIYIEGMQKACGCSGSYKCSKTKFGTFSIVMLDDKSSRTNTEM